MREVTELASMTTMKAKTQHYFSLAGNHQSQENIFNTDQEMTENKWFPFAILEVSSNKDIVLAADMCLSDLLLNSLWKIILATSK